MAKVWVVIDGCYSDQGLEGVFSTREKARECATRECTRPDLGHLVARVIEVDVDSDEGFWDSNEDRIERFDSDSPREDKSVLGTPLEND